MKCSFFLQTTNAEYIAKKRYIFLEFFCFYRFRRFRPFGIKSRASAQTRTVTAYVRNALYTRPSIISSWKFVWLMAFGIVKYTISCYYYNHHKCSEITYSLTYSNDMARVHLSELFGISELCAAAQLSWENYTITYYYYYYCYTRVCWSNSAHARTGKKVIVSFYKTTIIIIKTYRKNAILCYNNVPIISFGNKKKKKRIIVSFVDN